MHFANIPVAVAMLVLGAQMAVACDPAMTPLQEVLARRDVHFVDQFTPLETNYATFMRSDHRFL